MEYGVFILGIGGQGIQLVAKIFATAAVNEDRFVMLNGAYGGEMRGGKSMGTVHIGDAPLRALPVAASADAAVVLHDRFWDEPSERLTESALLVVDTETAASVAAKPDQTLVAIPSTDIALGLGTPLVAGMALIGAFNAVAGLVRHDTLVAAMEKLVPPHRAQHIQRNAQAMDAGRDAAGQLRHPLALAAGGVVT